MTVDKSEKTLLDLDNCPTLGKKMAGLASSPAVVGGKGVLKFLLSSCASTICNNIPEMNEFCQQIFAAARPGFNGPCHKEGPIRKGLVKLHDIY